MDHRLRLVVDGEFCPEFLTLLTPLGHLGYTNRLLTITTALHHALISP